MPRNPATLKPASREQGFTLLEVLLAFVIFAISFATVLEIVGGSVRSTVRARDYSEAALLAQSVMDQVGNQIPLIEGSYGGDDPNGYQWNLEIYTYQPQGEDDLTLELAEMTGTRLFYVDLMVTWGDGIRQREVRFSTVRSILAGMVQEATG